MKTRWLRRPPPSVAALYIESPPREKKQPWPAAASPATVSPGTLTAARHSSGAHEP